MVQWAERATLVGHTERIDFGQPFVEDDDKIFLKTIIPSRKMTKQYLEAN